MRITTIRLIFWSISLGLLFIAYSAIASSSDGVYIVEYKDEPIATCNGGQSGYSATQNLIKDRSESASEAARGYATELKSKQAATLSARGVSGDRLIYSYTTLLNGSAVRLSDEEVASLKRDPAVKKVRRARNFELHDDSVRKFLRLDKSNPVGPWSHGFTGEDVIVGIIDTGINPEHPSFADVATPVNGDDGELKAYGPPPAHWRGNDCEFGNQSFNAADQPFECNNKVLGARAFYRGATENSLFPKEKIAPDSFLSARDDDGHGSAVASVSSGNFGVQAEIYGSPAGEDMMSGVAPRSRIAVYKACWRVQDGDFCNEADVLAAVESATRDGVDVLNLSLGSAEGDRFALTDPTNVELLRANAAGVSVAVSAGNNGFRRTINYLSASPWVMSVGAINDNQNTTDFLTVIKPEWFVQDIEVQESQGVRLRESGVVTGNVKPAIPLDACADLANSDQLEGNIGLIVGAVDPEFDICSSVERIRNLQAAGAKAVLVKSGAKFLERIDPVGFLPDDIKIPVFNIYEEDGTLLQEVAESMPLIVRLDPQDTKSKANRVARFSSRGPAAWTRGYAKPDIVAPGVDILTASTPQGLRGRISGEESFAFISGTSFSSPAIAGAMALLKQARPDWTPAQIQSALMTTASRGQTVRNQGSVENASVFDVGSGLVSVTRALNPGLVYNAELRDYAAYVCGELDNFIEPILSFEECENLKAQGEIRSIDFNYPSMGFESIFGSDTAKRTVTAVDTIENNPRTYRAVIESEEGILIKATPSEITLVNSESADYTIDIDYNEDAVKFDHHNFNSLTWVEKGKPRRSQKSSLIGALPHMKEYFEWWFEGEGSEERVAREVRMPIEAAPGKLDSPSTLLIYTADETNAVAMRSGVTADYSSEYTQLYPVSEKSGTLLIGSTKRFCFSYDKPVRKLIMGVNSKPAFLEFDFERAQVRVDRSLSGCAITDEEFADAEIDPSEWWLSDKSLTFNRVEYDHVKPGTYIVTLENPPGFLDSSRDSDVDYVFKAASIIDEDVPDGQRNLVIEHENKVVKGGVLDLNIELINLNSDIEYRGVLTHKLNDEVYSESILITR